MHNSIINPKISFLASSLLSAPHILGLVLYVPLLILSGELKSELVFKIAISFYYFLPSVFSVVVLSFQVLSLYLSFKLNKTKRIRYILSIYSLSSFVFIAYVLWWYITGQQYDSL
jgi:hypothetical protein